MNDPLDRLLSASAHPPESGSNTEPPFGLETQVISAWRAANTENDGDDWLAAFRPTIVIASGFMLLCIAVSFMLLARLPERAPQSSEFTVADSAIRLALNP